MYRLKCSITVGGYDVLTRHVTFPCFPYPGLCVGGHVVARVLVCQGGLDGDGETEVEFRPVHSRTKPLLIKQGWK